MRHPTDLPGNVPWPKVKILVFSQDDAFRFLVRSTFRKLAVRDVLSTSVAADADHMVSYAPDVALVDFDGDPRAALEFISHIKAAPINPNPDMPILVAVKAADRLLVDPALNMGVEGVVPKPVSGHELSVRVAETISAPRRQPAPPPQVPPPPVPRAVTARPAAAASPVPVPAPAPPPASRAAAAPIAARPAAPVRPPAPAAPLRPRPAPVIETVVTPAKPKPSAPIELAPPPAPKRPVSEIETLSAKAPAEYRLEPRGEDDAARAAAEKRRKAWAEALGKAGHKPRTGKDVAAFDVAALVAAHLAWLTSQGAQGARANVQGRDLAGADLARTVLANATFREADLSDAKLTESRLDGCDFRYAKLGCADLGGANLGVAQLRHAKLRNANLEGAILRGADLSGGDLRGTRLAGADFKGATLISTDLRATDLSAVENLTTAQIEKAVLDAKTKLPPGVFRPAAEG